MIISISRKDFFKLIGSRIDSSAFVGAFTLTKTELDALIEEQVVAIARAHNANPSIGMGWSDQLIRKNVIARLPEDIKKLYE